MQTNGNAKRDHLRTMLLMMMYLVQEAKEHGFTRTAEILQNEITQLSEEYEMTEEELIPEMKE